MSSYQEMAVLIGANVSKMDLGVKFISDNGQGSVTLHVADETMIKGIAHSASKGYGFEINLTDIKLSKCLCGYYLGDKNGGIESREKLCSHQLAGLISADNGAVLVPYSPNVKQPRQPRQASASASNVQSVAGQYSFSAKISKAITYAIEDINDTVKGIIKRGKHPLMVGPTGCGKTSAVGQLINDKAFWLELFKDRRGIALEQFLPDGIGMLCHRVAGMESYADADIVGLRMQNQDVAGVIARAFKVAREGQVVMIFCDEFKRFDKRVQNLFMTALLPISVTDALAAGITTDEPIYMVEAPVWGVEYAPQKNIIWIFGTNEWGAPIDSAFARRIQACYIEYSEKVLAPLDFEFAEFIRTTWQMTAAGTLPLPVEYGMISGMKNGRDATMLPDYLANLRLVDPSLPVMIGNLIPSHMLTQQTTNFLNPKP